MSNDDLTPEEKAHVVRTVEKIADELITSRLLAKLTNEPISTFAPTPRTPELLATELRAMYHEGRLRYFGRAFPDADHVTVTFTYRRSDVLP